MENRDEMLQIDLCGGQVRVMLCETTATVQKCADIHETTPVCTAALGRLMTGTLMLGIMRVTDRWDPWWLWRITGTCVRARTIRRWTFRSGKTESWTLAQRSDIRAG